MTNPSGRPKDFLTCIRQHEGDDCLIWPYAKARGYGYVFHEGRVQGVHRVACSMKHGKAPEGHDAAHSCGNRLCCNPHHLRWATRSENNRDKVQQGKHLRGNRHPLSKYSEWQVRRLLELSKTQSVRSAALDLGMSYGVASKIVRGRAWPHVHETRKEAI